MKDDFSIVVTDSGLGGLSIMAELEKNLRENSPAEKIRLTFFNAVPDKKRGYNYMPDKEERIHVFNSALEGMVRCCDPDIIFIACNTLSVVYHETPFAGHTDITVLGIVEFGVDIAYRSLSDMQNSIVILLGTPTTIGSGVHKQKLLDRGIEAGRIVEQPCYMLESEIQDNPSGDATRKLIIKYLSEAKEKINSGYEKVFAAFCCTHYGYSIRIFEEELKNVFESPSIILDPKKLMSSYFSKDTDPELNNSGIKCKIVSRVPILDEEIKSLGELIKITSPKVYESLAEYHHNIDLF